MANTLDQFTEATVVGDTDLLHIKVGTGAESDKKITGANAKTAFATAAPEGTAVASTGETVGKVLTADGDDTSSWQAAGGTPEGSTILSTSITADWILMANGDGTTSWKEAPYATTAQGALADTATQPLDNVSTLTNDAGYLDGFTVGNSTFVSMQNVGTSTHPDITALLSATGTPDSTTYLRGDNTWGTPSGSSPLTTKGDLYGFSTVDARLPVGTNDYVLTADSTEALGVKWAAAASGGASLTTANEWTKTQNFNATTLSDGANISWDLESNQVCSVTLAGNRTLDNPTNMVDGATYVLTVKQDATGSRTLAYGTAYKWEGGTAPTLTTDASAVDILTFVSDGSSMFGVIAQDFS